MGTDQPIIGHAPELADLGTDLLTGNIAHAYLFSGPKHVGKFTTAKWFAKEILTRDFSAADRLEAERQIDRLIHPDYLVLDQLWIEDTCEDFSVIARSSNIPQQHRSKSPKIMKTDTISIDDVREIQARLQETGGGQFRICLIRGIERMRDEAANAFLKILEEPPLGRIFLLTTESTALVLPTLISRCRVVRFQRVSDRDILPVLRGLPEEEVKFILHLSQGAPGTALRLMQDPDALRDEKLRHTQALSFWNAQKLSERLKLLTPLHERGEEAERFTLHLALALREQGIDRAKERSLMELLRGLDTNAHRQLLAQRFALRLQSSV